MMKLRIDPLLRALLSVLGVYRLYKSWLKRQINLEEKPKHIGVILDGNRRWASSQSRLPWEGHRVGAEKAKEFLEWCLDLGIESITLYCFSTENFNRPKEEVEELMELLEEKLKELLNSDVIHEKRVKVRVIGRIDLLPERLRQLVYQVEEETKGYEDFYLNLAVAYGGRAEIVDAAKKIAERVEEGELEPGEIDEGLFEKHLYTSHLPQPDPDLIIRTSGEARLSGFLLWQSAYSELFFLDVYWPEFRDIDLYRAIRSYQRRQRRFGR